MTALKTRITSITCTSRVIEIRCPYTKDVSDSIKALDVKLKRWDAPKKRWIITTTAESYKEINKILTYAFGQEPLIYRRFKGGRTALCSYSEQRSLAIKGDFSISIEGEVL